jgi:mono/diheme cytochrome c family protein
MNHCFKIYGYSLIALFSLTMFIACASRRSEPVKRKTFTAETAQIANGERVFMEHCQRCHPGGEAGLGPAINSNPAPQFIKKFQVRKGLGVMPPFTHGEISSQEAKDISKYMRAWKSY